jgi:hypothetical protein
MVNIKKLLVNLHTIFIITFLISCSPTHIKSHMLVDMNHKIHSYKDNIHTLSLPLQNSKLTQYCMEHHRWENIRVLRNHPYFKRLIGQKARTRPILIIQYRVTPH